MKLAYPLKVNVITQRFGENPANYAQDGLAGHKSIDFRCSVGTDLLASADGEVIDVGDQGKAGYGKYLRIKTTDNRQLTYGHCSLVLVKKGDHVTTGKVIAKSGNTGRSTGPHLHFGLREYTSTGSIANYNNGFKGAIDPLPFLTMPIELTEARRERAAAIQFVKDKKIMSVTTGDISREDLALVIFRLYKELTK